ncbi:DUF397 domain-containing protein [Amycolatopsis sp. NPDC004625]|uniref:DUF397 domain-containing protein n=1 Tax=Amycolatopsis sp. NPDC004625 TaxID=3154670 RepID=UPI0033B3DEE3
MIAEGTWRKSSYSGSQANCVEVVAWGKSSYSTNDSNCVEVSSTSTTVGVRDTKDREGGHLTIPAPAWIAFVNAAGRTS